MKHVFYLLAIFPIFYEMVNVSSPKKLQDFHKRFKNLKSNEFDEWTEAQKTYSIFSLFYVAWVIVGLLTFQWPVFLFILLLSIIPKYFIWIRFVDSLITLSLLFFIIINAYHLHIDVWGWLTSLL